MLRMYHSLLPSWETTLDIPERLYSESEMAAFAVSLAKLNVEERTGGPFGAALFDEDGYLVAMGVNRVVPLKNALLHAEMVCISGALERFESHTLPSHHIFTLAASAQPCCMCLGALIWGGVKNLLIASSREEVESILGFDEGPISTIWQRELASRGIIVQTGLAHEEGRAVLELYQSMGGLIYNGGK